MKILKTLLIGLISLFVLVAIAGLFLPSSARVERSIVIERTPDLIFPVISSFERFNEWSPWHGIDPNAQYSYSGPPSGVGANMKWAGNDEVGTGSQTITALDPDKRVAIDLQFGDMDASKVEMLLAPEGNGTRVTWTLQSDFGYDLAGRYFGLLMDKFVGADYEKGLAQLKTVIEKAPATGTLPAEPMGGGEPASEPEPAE
jgi:hypothetical protein